MEKSSKIKLAVSLYLNSLKIVDIITKDEVIFPKEVAQKDYKELVCYAHSLFMAYNETHGKQLDDSIFYDSIADFCKSHFFGNNNAEEIDISERIAKSKILINTFLFENIKFIKNKGNPDNDTQYTSNILSQFPSCKEADSFLITNALFPTLIPKVTDAVGLYYNEIVSSWDETVDIVRNEDEITYNSCIAICNEKEGKLEIKGKGFATRISLKTDEEKEYLQDRYLLKALSSLTFFSLALVLPAAYLAISDFLNMNTLKSFMQHPFLSLLFVGGYLFAAAFCGFFVPDAFYFAIKTFNLEQAAREDKTAKFILAAVALFVVLILLTLIPVKEAFY